MSEKVIIGIDPGAKGAMVALFPDGRAEAALTNCGLAFLLNKDCQVILEQTNAFWKGSRSSAHTLGEACGYWKGVLEALKIPYQIVRPTSWYRALLKDLSGEPKERALVYVRRMLPDLKLIPDGCRVPHDGIVAAACLALYGKMKWGKE